MSYEEAVTINVQLEVCEIESYMSNLSIILESISSEISSINTTIQSSFSNSYDQINAVMSNLGDELKSCCEGIANTLNAISTSLSTIYEEMKASGKSDMLWNFAGLISDVVISDKKSKGSKRRGKYEYRGKFEAESRASSNDVILGVFADPSAVIGGLSDITEAFDLNTQARNNNSAAGLSQIAAMADLNAMSETSSAVTGIFGKAISFLQTPLGITTAAIAAVVTIGILLYQNWDKICAFAQTAWTVVQEKFSVFSNFLVNVFATDWTEQFGAFGEVLNAFFGNIENIWNAVTRIFNGIVDFVKSIFAGDWESAWNSVIEIFGGIWDGIVAFVKAPINGIFGLINGMIQGIVDGINNVIGMINSISFTFPDWIPLLGGTTFSPNIKTIQAPQIPYLAKGAVLPANRPFLAMVGDQKHGTNVEAPLATIQEALANVLAQQGMGGDIHITFTGDLAQLGRVLKPVIERENRRVGASLAKGVM